MSFRERSLNLYRSKIKIKQKIRLEEEECFLRSGYLHQLQENSFLSHLSFASQGITYCKMLED